MSLSHDFTNELSKRFTGDLRLDAASRTLYSTDASMYQIEPLGVAIPKTQDDLQAAVELAAKYKVPILPRGAGSSLAGQAIGEALILDCSRWLDSMIDIDAEAKTATVEPGVVLSTLNAAAAKHGLTFGPDPASAERATLGGVIGNNATGAHSILYGMTADHLLSADVILADGALETWGELSKDEVGRMKDEGGIRGGLIRAALEVRERYAHLIRENFPATWRNSAGYRLNYLLPWSPSTPPRWDSNDYGLPSSVYHPRATFNLAPLLAGSEGTLAVIRRATLKLVEKPKHTILAVLAYASNAEACDDVPRLLELEPSAVELVPQMILRMARSVPAYARQMGWLAGDPAALLVVEFSGDQPSALKDRVERCRNDAALRLRSAGANFLTVAESKEDQSRIWNVRKVGLGLLDSRPRSARPAAFIEDCAIPVEKLGDFVRDVERIMAEHGAEGGIYAHASAGCLHIRPILDLHRGEGVRALRGIAEQVCELTLRLGGSMSSEHGDGIARGEWVERTYGKEVTDAMRQLKRAADPHGILNPKKMFEAPPMDTNLRYGEGYHAQAWEPALRFDHERGLAGAIEQCNGQGVCRKIDGVMCPSFQATREEQNSTRGRANLLRALMTGAGTGDGGPSSVHGLQSAVYEALDLCLACKGCKAECPSGVDMAKLKYEFENEYYKQRRRPLRDYVFGYFHIAAGLASSIAPLANAVTGVPLFRNIMAKALGITDRRPFPKFSMKRAKPGGALRSQRALPQSDTSKERILSQGGMTDVIFITDPFARYVEPEVEQAAFDVLAACGYNVRLLPVIGAGASLLSKGFVEAAKHHAAKALDALNQLDPRGEAAVVGIEPPDLYCLKNDYFDLLPHRHEEIARRVRNVWLLDEFLVRSETFREILRRFAAQDDNAASRPQDDNVALRPQNDRRKVKFQPHCHQRAEGPAADGLPSGSAATAEALRLCGYDVEVLNGGCCGMAGTFGYEAEHYELSMKVGGLKVLPAVREWDGGEGAVVGTGAACRMQITQGAGVEARHPVMLVRETLLSRP